MVLLLLRRPGAKEERRREVPLRKPILPVRAYARCLVVLLNVTTDFEPVLINLMNWPPHDRTCTSTPPGPV